MATPPPPDAADLAQAADTLAAELTRFEELTVALQRERLNSEKALKRAAQRLEQIADCDARLAQYVEHLVSAIGTARSRQEQQAAVVQECAAQIQQRADALARLQAQVQLLQQQAGQVNVHSQQLLTAQNGGEARELLRTGIAALRDAVQSLVEQAQALMEKARADDFLDLARDAESLRVQLLATRNKLELLERRLS